MKRLLILALGVCLTLVGVEAVNAADWNWTGGLEYLSGQYRFVANSDSDRAWDFAVAVPRLRYTVEGRSDNNWWFSAFHGADETTDAEVDPGFQTFMTKYTGAPRGRAKALGADLGYQVKMGATSITPQIGYRDTEFLTGAKNPASFDPDGDGRLETYTFGLRVRGVRVGLEVEYTLSERLRFEAEGGYSPWVQTSELRQADHEAGDYGAKSELDVRRPPVQESSAFDLSARLSYRFGEHLALDAGYRYEGGAADFAVRKRAPHGGCMADEWEYRAGQTYLGARYVF